MSKPSPRPSRLPRPVLLAAILIPACASPRRTAEGERMQVQVYNNDAKLERGSIGVHLARIDTSLQQWHQIFLAGNPRDDMVKLKGLSDDIRNRTARIFDEAVSQLETGAPFNRRVVAAALGFTQTERARTPLLNALSDPDQDVVANALLGLSVLSDPLTPLQGILHHLKFGSTDGIRSNAALAALEILRVGGDGGPTVVEAAQTGLRDDAPLVRTQCALILAHQLDVDSIEDLTLQLHGDSVNSAAMAAGRALAYIGSREVTAKGRCARALSAALSKLEGLVKASVLHDLRRLAARNYASDEDWVAWAHRLP